LLHGGVVPATKRCVPKVCLSPIATLLDDPAVTDILIIVANMFMSGAMAGLELLFLTMPSQELGEVRECGGPTRANGLWVALFTWNFVTPEAA